MNRSESASKNLLFLLKNRFVLFFLILAALTVISKYFSGSWLPSTETKDLWFYSGLFMVIFSMFFIEPFYTSPKNVITNVIPLILVFVAIKNTFLHTEIWWIAILFLVGLIFFSISAMALETKNESEASKRNRYANNVKNVVVFLGRGKIIYSLVFFYFIFINYSLQTRYSLTLIIFWGVVILINPKMIHNDFSRRAISKNSNQIGEIIGVQSKKIFLVKLFEDRKGIKKFDIVKFRYSMQDYDDIKIVGIIFDTYLLNQEKWAKVLQLGDTVKDNSILEKNIVYKLSENTEIEETEKSLNLDMFVGIVTEGSTIGKIKFEYSKRIDDLQEGDLLQLSIGKRKLFYQVVGGTTENERLEDRNEMGFIEGEAIQLGLWKLDNFSFEKFGWVPPINTPVFKSDGSDVSQIEYAYPHYSIGNIPGTTLPAIVDLNDAVSHHLALIGITGSGKSFLAREIINQIMEDTKIIAVDFNKEFVTTLEPSPENIISPASFKEVEQRIIWISSEQEKWPRDQNKTEITKKQGEIASIIGTEIENFLEDEKEMIAVFELPDVSNQSGIFDYTKYFFRVLFEVAKEKQLQGNIPKICVVLEEAHTVIPEWNFSGSSDKNSQAIVNSIGQITLQGRKYGVGFLVIAQRTANVSKTVLTQCNTIICFQAYDETSFAFLKNYVGKDMVGALPNLKDYHAVIAGKGVKSNMPLIVDLTRDVG